MKRGRYGSCVNCDISHICRWRGSSVGCAWFVRKDRFYDIRELARRKGWKFKYIAYDDRDPLQRKQLTCDRAEDMRGFLNGLPDEVK